MKLSLQDLRRLADEIAGEEDPPFEVAGATHAEGGPTYAEIIFSRRDGHADTDPVVVGVDRDMTEEECRKHIRAQLRRLLQPQAAGARD
jgi:hypothetical protein